MTKSLFAAAMGSLLLADASSASITGSVSAGYDSEYYFRGLWFSSNNVYGAASISVPLAEKFSLSMGALYTQSMYTELIGPDLAYSELDLFASLNYDAGWGKIGFVATNYNFFKTFSGETNGNSFGFASDPDSTITNASDLGLTFAIPVGDFNLYAAGYYDLRIHAAYFELGADYTYKFSDKFSIVPSVQLGYAGNDYYTYKNATGEDSGFTHIRAGITAPYKVTDAFTITPYVALNVALEAREDINTARPQEDLFGGLSLSYSF
jgi:hypothetical protein